jgi:hypothetical protein
LNGEAAAAILAQHPSEKYREILLSINEYESRLRRKLINP